MATLPVGSLCNHLGLMIFASNDRLHPVALITTYDKVAFAVFLILRWNSEKVDRSRYVLL